jgi:hypothetical protein
MNEYIEEYGDDLASIIGGLSRAIEEVRSAETAMRQLALRRAHVQLTFARDIVDKAYIDILGLERQVERATRN